MEVEVGLDAHFASGSTAGARRRRAPAAPPPAQLHSAFLGKDIPTVQWYPGHIARAERQLMEQLRLVDVVIEVRDARCPLATAHPALDDWFRSRQGTRRVLVVNREDMLGAGDLGRW